MACETCGRSEEQCGIAMGCCGSPHTDCVDCKGRRRVGPAGAASANGAPLSGSMAGENCTVVACGHPAGLHVATGQCCVVVGPNKRPTAVVPMLGTPKGFVRCACTGLSLPDDEAGEEGEETLTVEA